MTTISTSLTNLTALLSQSHECSYCVGGRIQHAYCSDCRNSDLRTHDFTTSRTLPNCVISLGSLMMSAPESGDSVESILLARHITVRFTET